MKRSTMALLALVTSLLLFSSTPLVAQEVAEEYSTVAAYLIEDGRPVADEEAGLAPTKTEDRDYQALWKHVLGVITPELAGRVSRFEVFRYAEEVEEVSDATTSLEEDGEGWIFAVNWDSAKPAIKGGDRAAARDFDTILVHEAAHMLALSADQMQGRGKKTAGTLEVDEGVTKPDSYLNRFYGAFWKGRYPAWKGEDLSFDTATSIHERYPEAFVTDYAATSPNEDLAESFAVFVTGPRPAGRAEKEDKVAFFWAWPELVTLRASMRRGMGLK